VGPSSRPVDNDTREERMGKIAVLALAGLLGGIGYAVYETTSDDMAVVSDFLDVIAA
jgi:hypothetical protein